MNRPELTVRLAYEREQAKARKALENRRDWEFILSQAKRARARERFAQFVPPMVKARLTRLDGWVL